jgi:hypothetical protein
MTTTSIKEIRASSVGVKVQGNLSGTAAIWSFTILCNLMAAYFYFISHESLKKPLPEWFFIPFFGFGALLTLFAIYVTASRILFGWPIFQCESNASVPGGAVEGTIHIPKPFAYRKPIRLRLACVRGQIQHFVGNRNFVRVDHIVWEESRTLDQYLAGTRVEQIPVNFRVPIDAKPSHEFKAGYGIFWILEAGAKTSILPFFCSFNIPVTAHQADL